MWEKWEPSDPPPGMGQDCGQNDNFGDCWGNPHKGARGRQVADLQLNLATTGPPIYLHSPWKYPGEIQTPGKRGKNIEKYWKILETIGKYGINIGKYAINIGNSIKQQQ